jgi:hypothetical protein
MRAGEKLGFNLKLSTGWAGIERHGVLIAAAIFSKVLRRFSCATPRAEGLAGIGPKASHVAQTGTDLRLW